MKSPVQNTRISPRLEQGEHVDQPVYLTRLLRQKVLLAVGLVASIAVGVFAGFTLENGELIPRASRVYTATADVLLSSQSPTFYQVEIPGVTQALPQAPEGEEQAPAQELIVQEPVPIDVASNAIVLAYLASSDAIAADVVGTVGELGDDEDVSAVSRTTQPTGDERFPGRFELPVVQIGATAQSPGRAESIAGAAVDAFLAMVVAQQTELGLPEDIRIVPEVLTEPVADEGEGSNPMIPVVIVAFGTFLVVIALALIVEIVRERLAVRRLARRRTRGPGAAPGADEAVAEETRSRRDELIGAGSSSGD